MAFLALVAVVSFLAIPISAFYHYTVPSPDYGGSYIEGLIGAPKFINPLLAQANDVDRDLSSIIYQGLMKYNGQGELEPALAESYEVSNDGLNYTFKLRPNLRWHDGKPITADDVIFTILTVQNADYDSFHRIIWQGVGASKLDNLTVKFTLKNKYAQFLTNTTVGILPKHIWENIKATNFAISELNIKPTVGSGPFKFSKIKRDATGNIKSLEITAFNDRYEDKNFQKPFISKIIFKFYDSEPELLEAYNSNDVDGVSFISPQNLNSLRFTGRLKIKKVNLPRYFAIFFNQNQSKTLSDKNVRLAANYAVDKQGILSRALSNNGDVIDSPMLPGIINLPYAAEKYEFDAERASQILEEAGWRVPEGADPKIREKEQEKLDESAKLVIRLTTSNWPELTLVANEIKKQWEAVGIAVDLEILPLPELQQVIKDRAYEALLFGEVLGLDPDPFSFWHSSQKRDPGLNLALYDNKDADRLLEEARQTLDSVERLGKYDELQKIIIADAPAVFLYSPFYIYALSSKIKGVEIETIPLPSDRFGEISKWYIETRRVRK